MPAADIFCNATDPREYAGISFIFWKREIDLKKSLLGQLICKIRVGISDLQNKVIYVLDVFFI